MACPSRITVPPSSRMYWNRRFAGGSKKLRMIRRLAATSCQVKIRCYSLYNAALDLTAIVAVSEEGFACAISIVCSHSRF
jgi:hypothetical protein